QVRRRPVPSPLPDSGGLGILSRDGYTVSWACVFPLRSFSLWTLVYRTANPWPHFSSSVHARLYLHGLDTGGPLRCYRPHYTIWRLRQIADMLPPGISRTRHSESHTTDVRYQS